jgi:hypothetical protein
MSDVKVNEPDGTETEVSTPSEPAPSQPDDGGDEGSDDGED